MHLDINILQTVKTILCIKDAVLIGKNNVSIQGISKFSIHKYISYEAVPIRWNSIL